MIGWSLKHNKAGSCQASFGRKAAHKSRAKVHSPSCTCKCKVRCFSLRLVREKQGWVQEQLGLWRASWESWLRKAIHCQRVEREPAWADMGFRFLLPGFFVHFIWRPPISPRKNDSTQVSLFQGQVLKQLSCGAMIVFVCRYMSISCGRSDLWKISQIN